MNRFSIYALAGIVVVADQLTKWQIVRTLTGDRVIDVVPGYFDLTLVHNTGGAFGIMPHSTIWLVAAAIAAVVGILTFTFRARGPIPTSLGVALALPLGGATGNLIDRVRLKYVVDFLHAHAHEHDFPVFNVADSCICVGVGLLAIYFWSRPEPTTVRSSTPEGAQPVAAEKETI